MNNHPQPPVPDPAFELTCDLINLAQVGDRDGFSARLETVEDEQELCASLVFLRAFRKADFVQLIDTHIEQRRLATLPQARGDGHGSKRL